MLASKKHEHGGRIQESLRIRRSSKGFKSESKERSLEDFKGKDIYMLPATIQSSNLTILDPGPCHVLLASPDSHLLRAQPNLLGASTNF